MGLFSYLKTSFFSDSLSNLWQIKEERYDLGIDDGYEGWIIFSACGWSGEVWFLMGLSVLAKVAFLHVYSRKGEEEPTNAVDDDCRHDKIGLLITLQQGYRPYQIHQSSKSCKKIHIKATHIFLITLTGTLTRLGQHPPLLPSLWNDDEAWSDDEVDVSHVGIVDKG